jgi:hypothetical protein
MMRMKRKRSAGILGLLFGGKPLPAGDSQQIGKGCYAEKEIELVEYWG